jgi:hypothetical protein
MIITEKEYVDEGGCNCPNCLSEEMTSGPIEIDAGVALVKIAVFYGSTKLCKKDLRKFNFLYTVITISNAYQLIGIRRIEQ